MTNISFQQDPAANLDYIVDWSGWLGSDTLSTSSFTVSAGMTKGTTSNTSTTATVWLSGGTDGGNYTVSNLITTGGGRTDSRTFIVNVRTQ